MEEGDLERVVQIKLTQLFFFFFAFNAGLSDLILALLSISKLLYLVSEGVLELTIPLYTALGYGDRIWQCGSRSQMAVEAMGC